MESESSSKYVINHSQKVKDSCSFVFSKMSHINFNEDKLNNLVTYIHSNLLNYDTFDESSCHPTTSELTFEDSLGFCFIIDSINFCFWPNNFEYEDLVSNIKSAMMAETNIFSPANLLLLSDQKIKSLIFKNMTDVEDQIPERIRLLKEMAQFLVTKYHGSYSEMVLKTNYNALELLHEIVTQLVGFQDHTVYKTKQIFFYKRAQILVGDINEVLVMFKKSANKSLIPSSHSSSLNKMNIKGLSQIEEITSFADYRVPQVLNHFGVLTYSSDLTSIVNQKSVINSGSEYEIEIRAGMIQVVELIKEKLKTNHQIDKMSIEVDWILWQYGEKNLPKLIPHHRVLTIFY
jgi:hypothetical protein